VERRCIRNYEGGETGRRGAVPGLPVASQIERDTQVARRSNITGGIAREPKLRRRVDATVSKPVACFAALQTETLIDGCLFKSHAINCRKHCNAFRL
jgi:hypothetical protein